jgi:NAD(P)H dehydrogenase (quinone)
MTIAITGATGQLGRLVTAKLKSKIGAGEIIGLVRSPEKAADLGVAVRAADYSKPETLRAALNGVATLLLISSSEIGNRVTQHNNVIAAAKAAGVKHIVYTSLLHADTNPIIDLAEEHQQTEAALKASGIAFTILRNGWYMENHIGSIQGALAGGAFIGSAGEGKISSAPRADYADAAVAVLTSRGHEGKTYELAGDEAWTLSELAQEISKASGKNIPFMNLAPEEYATALTGFGLPEPFAKAIASWDFKASKGALHDDTQQLSKLIGRPTTPMAQAVRAAISG